MMNEHITLNVSDGNVSLPITVSVGIGGKPAYEGPYTVTPSKAEQVLETAGTTMDENVTVQAISEDYYDMSGPNAWMGLDAELCDPAFYTWSGTLADTGFPDWTPSTAEASMKASESLQAAAIDLDTYDYWIKWSLDFTAAYTPDAVLINIPVRQVITMWQSLHKRPSTIANLESETDNRNYCTNAFTDSNILEYYNGSWQQAVIYGQASGFYGGLTAATFSSSTSGKPNVTRKTPALYAKCNSNYMNTSRIGGLDAERSTWKVRGDMYRVKKTTSAVQRFYHTAVDLYNNPL